MPQIAQEIIDDDKAAKLTLDMTTGNGNKNVELAMVADIIKRASEKGKPVVVETDMVTIEMSPNTIDLEEKDKVSFKC